MMNIRTLTATVLLIFTSISCVGGEHDKPKQDQPNQGQPKQGQPKLIGASSAKDSVVKESSEVYHQMIELANNTYCESSSDCGVVAVGQRACGGPSKYMVYSKHIGEESQAQLVSLSQRSKELAMQVNLKQQMMGICQVLPAVTAICVDNQCVGQSVNGQNEGILPTE